MEDRTRALGVPGARAALSGRADGNMGFTLAPDPAAVAAARRRFLDRAGMDAASAVAVLQVHGRAVLRVGPGLRGRGGLDPATLPAEADALVTTERGIPLLALGADCCVGALAAPEGRGVAVFHAGWRGALAGAPEAAARALAEAARVPVSALRGLLGPAIGPCCYEVGEEVAEAYREGRGPAAEAWFRRPEGGRPRLDLPAAVTAGLCVAGMAPETVGAPGPCTLCGEGWFSHRRGDAGRQMLAAALG
jgi:YfiH family protein